MAPTPRIHPAHNRFGRFVALWKQRQRLANLDDAALNDIGVTRSQADSEANRPVWDVPAHWRD